MTPYGLSLGDEVYCQYNRCGNRYVRYRTIRLFILMFFIMIILFLLSNDIQLNFNIVCD